MKFNSRPVCRLIVLLFACAAVLSVPALVSAGIVSFSGVTPLGGPPAPNVLPGSQPPVPTPIVFPEFVNGVILAGGVDVDHNGSAFAGPVSTANVVNPLLVNTTIPAGTRVDSYFFHFDPADLQGPGNFYPASSIQFDTQILGVQLFSSAAPLQKPALTAYAGTLEDGDSVPVFYGGPIPPYYPGGLATRGLEDDAMSITLGGTQITLAGAAFGVEIDQVRIYVAAVPEPASLALVGGGLAGLWLLTARMRAARRG